MDADEFPVLECNEECQALLLSYKERYGTSPSIIARAPGRVNLIGEHIDYMGYGVLPMALARSCLVAAGRANEGGDILCGNVDSGRFPMRRIRTSPTAGLWREEGEEEGDDSPPPRKDWVHYVQCALKGLLDSIDSTHAVASARAKLEGSLLMVHGHTPESAGLSSSSALVVASFMALAHLAGLSANMGRQRTAQMCADCERHVGTAGGGMDQSVSCLAEQGAGLHISFDPLVATTVPLPEGATFVVCNSLVSAEKAVSAATHFNKRVVECRLACLLMGRAVGLDAWAALKTLRQLQQQTEAQGKGLVDDEAVSRLLHDEPYSLTELAEALGLSPAADATAMVHAFFPDRASAALLVLQANEHFFLARRATHVLNEAERVRQFKAVCEERSLPADARVQQLGRLMDESHASCRDLYDCSCPELDRLVDLCKASGAVGSRLTGAGWGGCCVSLVPSDRVASFMQQVGEEYYRQQGSSSHSGHMFVSSPGPGASYHRPPAT